jgi:hypothetical protein
LKKQDLKVAITVKKSIITITETLNPNWVSGFVSGDGSFFLYIGKTKKN